MKRQRKPFFPGLDEPPEDYVTVTEIFCDHGTRRYEIREYDHHGPEKQRLTLSEHEARDLLRRLSDLFRDR